MDDCVNAESNLIIQFLIITIDNLYEINERI